MKKHIVVVITGASGACYGLGLIRELLAAGCRVSLLVSDAGRQVVAYETGLDLATTPGQTILQIRNYLGVDGELECYAVNDFFAPVASGTAAPDAVVIVPCSMGTAGRIASGLSENLIERVADVALKERRELILVPRETPFNQIHLENLLSLSKAGAVILPAMPAFYQNPESIDDMVNFVVGKILDALRVNHQLFTRWGSEGKSE
ncbi:MAG: aromatic acid decarboxylase [Desulfuromonas sp.]|nr:MAG: aromatic acid decarboxylase [Desulfuromonas sp.]